MFASSSGSFTANPMSGRGRRNAEWNSQQQSGRALYEQPYQSNSEDIHRSRTAIKDLTPHQPNTVIIGIVVTKQNVHSFPDKRNPGSERFKCTFTVRDSPSDYINVTCWGSEEFIRKLHTSFKICDVVKLQNCQILSKTGGEQEDRWKPWTPSQYQLNVSETHSSLSLYSGWDYTEFTALAHIPLRPHNDFYTLSDILSNGQTLDGSHINMLAAIRHVGTPKQMNSRSGKLLNKCDVKLMDDGCQDFTLFLWDEVLIDLAQTWIPKENIIFIVDAKVTFDSYRNCMVATCDQKSIVTTNPNTVEAHQLYRYAQTVDLGSFSEQDNNFTGGHFFNSSQNDVQSISQVYSVEELKQEQEGKVDPWTMQSSSCSPHFCGILYAIVTSLEIDHHIKNVICYRCTSCRFRVERDATQCSNVNCSSQSSATMGGFSCEPHFNLLISLSDQTGGVDGVRLSGQPAIDILACTPQDFLVMSEQKKIDLKHSLLLERFKIYFKSATRRSDQRNSKPLIQILRMEHATPMEVANHIE